jgi:hypothetical protein
MKAKKTPKISAAKCGYILGTYTNTNCYKCTDPYRIL